MDHIFPYIDSSQLRSKYSNESSGISYPSVTHGKHCILELYECDSFRLDDEAFIRTTITSSAKKAGATLINMITHPFQPHGVTGLALLAESHISIHTWPEVNYAAIDVFTCGDKTFPEKACHIFIKEFLAKEFSLKSFNREMPLELRQSLRKSS